MAAIAMRILNTAAFTHCKHAAAVRNHIRSSHTPCQFLHNK